MPLGLRSKKKDRSRETSKLVESEAAAPAPPSAAAPAPSASASRLQFHAQLAHGSPTGRVGGFGSARELYAKIAEAFGIDPAEVGPPPCPGAAGARRVVRGHGGLGRFCAARALCELWRTWVSSASGGKNSFCAFQTGIAVRGRI